MPDTTPRDILAERLSQSHGNMHGPMARLHAENQLDALNEAGFVIVPRFDLVSLWGFLGSAAKHLPLLVSRQGAQRWRKTVRSWIDIENDSGAGE